jgi:hypothetical protein
MGKNNSGITMLVVIMIGICILMCSGVLTAYVQPKKQEGYKNTNKLTPTNLNKPSKMDDDTEINTGVKPAEALGQNDVYKSVNSTDTRMTQQSQDPLDLLPKDENSAWAELNPMGKGELDNINLLSPGHHIGIDTVGTSKRNSNLQVRGEFPNPKIYSGPWNNSTIDQHVEADRSRHF